MGRLDIVISDDVMKPIKKAKLITIMKWIAYNFLMFYAFIIPASGLVFLIAFAHLGGLNTPITLPAWMICGIIFSIPYRTILYSWIASLIKPKMVKRKLDA